MKAKGENLRERVRQYGRTVVEREEMIHLGFLKPEARGDYEAAYKDLTGKLRELRKLDKRIDDAQDVEKLLNEIRRHRIEEVERRKIARRAAKADAAKAKRQAHEKRKRETPPFFGAWGFCRTRFHRRRRLGAAQTASARDQQGP